jgi:ACS family glucarate transporter-like MFS transporter
MANTALSARVKSVGHRRYWIMLLLLLLVTINYIDRANLAIAGPQMAKEFGWSLGVLGVAFSALFWVYAPCLLLWGALIDVIGTRLAYAIGLFIWSAASVATGTINGFGALLGARWALGLGESVMPSACAKVVREWMPARERGLGIGAFTAGYYAGPAIGFPICAWLVSSMGWRAMFFVLGGTTFVFFFVWLFFYYRPEQAKWLAEDEREMILAERNSAALQTTGLGMTRLDLLRHPTTWGLVIAQATSTYTQYMFLTWLPGYLLKAQHLDLKQAGAYSMIPYVAALLGSIAFGLLSDRLLSAKTRDGGRRRIYVVVSMLASMAILLVPATDNFALIMFLLAVALTGSGCTLTTNVSLANDMLVDPKYGGLLFGLLGIGSNCLALLAPIVTGVVAQVTGDFAGAFLVAGTLSAIGITCVFVLVRKPITVSAAYAS